VPHRPLTVVTAVGAIVLVATLVTIERDGFPSRLSAAALAFDSAGIPTPQTPTCAIMVRQQLARCARSPHRYARMSIFCYGATATPTRLPRP